MSVSRNQSNCSSSSKSRACCVVEGMAGQGCPEIEYSLSAPEGPLHGVVGVYTSTPCSNVSRRSRSNWLVVTVRDYHRGQTVGTGRQRESQDTSEEEQSTEEDREAEETRDEEEGERILAASLAFVPQRGWTTDAIAEGARSLGLSGTVHGIFPRGGYDIISFFERQCNERLTSHLKQLSDPQRERSGQCKSPLDQCCNHTPLLPPPL